MANKNILPQVGPLNEGNPTGGSYQDIAGLVASADRTDSGDGHRRLQPTSNNTERGEAISIGRVLLAWTKMQQAEQDEQTLWEKIQEKLDSMDGVVSKASNIHKTVKSDLSAVMSLTRRMEVGRDSIRRSKDSFALLLNSIEVPAGEETANSTESPKIRQKRKKRTTPSPEEANKKKKQEKGPALSIRVQRPLKEIQRIALPPVHTPVGSTAEETDWEIATKRSRKRRNDKKEAPRPRVKPDAILVKRKDASETFASVLKMVKQKVDQKIVGDKVSKIRQTKSGDLLIQLQKGSNVKDIKEAVTAAIGTKTTVLQLSQQVTLDVRDIDGDTTLEEVQLALAEATGVLNEEVKVKAIRPAFSGTQMAIVTMTRVAALNIIKTGKARIGWVNARVRERNRVPRCFKCLGFGHIATNCEQGINGEKPCFLCGAKDHLAADCRNDPKCVQCEEIGALHDHRSGSAKCTALAKAMERKQGKQNG